MKRIPAFISMLILVSLPCISSSDQTDVSGDWDLTVTTQRGEMTITWNGEVSGETMSGEVQFGSFRTAQWEGTKQSN